METRAKMIPTSDFALIAEFWRAKGAASRKTTINKAVAIPAHAKTMISFFSVPILSIMGYMKEEVSSDNETPNESPKMRASALNFLKTKTVKKDVKADIKTPHKIRIKNDM